MFKVWFASKLPSFFRIFLCLVLRFESDGHLSWAQFVCNTFPGIFPMRFKMRGKCLLISILSLMYNLLSFWAFLEGMKSLNYRNNMANNSCRNLGVRTSSGGISENPWEYIQNHGCKAGPYLSSTMNICSLEDLNGGIASRESFGKQ